MKKIILMLVALVAITSVVSAALSSSFDTDAMQVTITQDAVESYYVYVAVTGDLEVSADNYTMVSKGSQTGKTFYEAAFVNDVSGAGWAVQYNAGELAKAIDKTGEIAGYNSIGWFNGANTGGVAGYNMIAGDQWLVSVAGTAGIITLFTDENDISGSTIATYTVPEPMTLGLLGLGGLLVARRRRQA